MLSRRALWFVGFLAIGFLMRTGSSGCAAALPQHLTLTHLPPNNFPLEPPHRIGLMNINNESDAAFFYWLAPCSSPTEKNPPIIIWLNGGPGCSSLRGLFEENGPISVANSPDETYSISDRLYSWNKFAHMMYIDSPIGTGFSIEDPDVPPPRQQFAIAIQLAHALTKFFVTDNAGGFKKIKNSEIYIGGESYGSKFVIHLAEAILSNFEGHFGYLRNHLKGLLWHSGLISPMIQRFGTGVKAIEDAIIGPRQAEQLISIEDRCRRYVELGGKMNEGNPCDDIETFLTIASGGIASKDIRKQGELLIKEPLSEAFINYLLQSGALDIGTVRGRRLPPFQMCSAKVKREMAEDAMRSVEFAFVDVLIGRIPIMMLHGQFDNRLGVAPMQRLLDLASNFFAIFGETFTSSSRALWNIKDKLAGYVKHMRLLPLPDPVIFITVRDAGHYISIDQPEIAFEAARIFVNNETFCDKSSCNVGKLLCDDALARCSGNGVCEPSSGRCVCHTGFAGAECNATIIHTNITLDLYAASTVYRAGPMTFHPSEWLYISVSFPIDPKEVDVFPYIGITMDPTVRFISPNTFKIYFQSDVLPTDDKNELVATYNDVLGKRLELPVDPYTLSTVIRNTTRTPTKRLYFIGIKNVGAFNHHVTIHIETVKPKMCPLDGGSTSGGGKKGGKSSKDGSKTGSSDGNTSSAWKLLVIILVPTLMIWAITATIYACLLSRRANVTAV